MKKGGYRRGIRASFGHSQASNSKIDRGIGGKGKVHDTTTHRMKKTNLKTTLKSFDININAFKSTCPIQGDP